MDYYNYCHFITTLGDFSGISPSCWSKYIVTPDVSHIDSLTTTYCLQKIIPEPTQIFPHSSSCIGVILKNQPSFVL